MDPRTIARTAAAGRVAIGVALLAAPRPAGKRWLGDVAEEPGAQLAISGIGSRDLILGLGTLWALDGRKRKPRAWLIGSAIADASDFISTLRARKGLPTASVAGTLAIASAAAALFGWLQSELD